MGKNRPFIEFFYKYAPAFPAPKSLFFIDSIFSFHSFTPTDFQRITVNPPVFSLHPPFTIQIYRYPFIISSHLLHPFPERRGRKT